MKPIFDHEKLVAYQESIVFCGWVGELLASITTKLAVKDQLDRASTSIPLNFAEGNGKFSDADRSRYLEIARGSALECAACLDVLVVRKVMTADAAFAEKERLARIVGMLLGLLKRFSDRASVIREDAPVYGGTVWDQDQEQEQDQDLR